MTNKDQILKLLPRRIFAKLYNSTKYFCRAYAVNKARLDSAEALSKRIATVGGIAKIIEKKDRELDIKITMNKYEDFAQALTDKFLILTRKEE